MAEDREVSPTGPVVHGGTPPRRDAPRRLHAAMVLRGAMVLRATVTAAVALVVVPGVASAHAIGGLVVSPLPLVVYLAGAAIAVALSFGFVMVRDADPPAREPGRVRSVPRWAVVVLRAIGLAAWLWIAAQLVIGGSSDADVATLFLWVYVWVGVAIVSALVGPMWTWLDPFATLFDIGAWVARRVGVRGWEPAPLPDRFAYWPAVIGFTAFVWLELAAFGSHSGAVIVGYTVFTLAAMSQFGRDEWRERGETFSVWFATLGRMAPVELISERPATVRSRGYATGLSQPWSLPLVVLIAVATGGILYDGISQTAPWSDRFPLPSVTTATVLLAAFLAIVVLVILAVGRRVGIAALGAGLLPIAIGYLVAHYFTYLLADGQRLFVALSDPFQLGWDLFGTAFYEPDTSWLPPIVVWTVQLAAVVGGHVVGAWAGHAVARRGGDHDRSALRRRELPLAVLMVALTATTLWSLGQATVVDPGSQPPPAASVGGR